MPKHSKKGLSEEDRELWRRVAKTATPLNPRSPVLPAKPLEKKATARKSPETPTFQLPDFRIGQTAQVATRTARPEAQVSPIDRKQLTRLKRGKLKPQARIDLHGMTQDQAQPALNRFIQRAAERELRLVLVITGKGRPRPDYGPIPEQPGILRRNVPLWLRSGLLARLVMDVVEAHQSHGGSGAFYVYLRARR